MTNYNFGLMYCSFWQLDNLLCVRYWFLKSETANARMLCIAWIGRAMEDGGVDATVIDKMGQMAVFPPILAPSVFDL